MVRTQIYLTEAQQQGLRAVAQRRGVTQSELIREAVDAVLVREEGTERLFLLQKGRSIWAGRSDLPDFVSLRRELDR